MSKAAVLIIPVLIFLNPLLLAQKQVTGKVTDAKTGEPLPAAHVIIKDTYKGTITNRDGEFNLKINEFPVTLIARFIGFETQEKVITSGHTGEIHFMMKESIIEMGEIVVTGEDPAITIMKEVIRRKQIWRANLNTYKAEAYTRQQLKNDTAIVSISESISVAYWDRERGSREVLKSKRQTANMDEGNNFAGVSYLPNFYDDNLEVAGFDMVGITHPDALSYYDFKLEDIQSIDDQVVYKLSVSSKRKLQPLFEGTIFVLGEEYALLEVDLTPNSVVVFPPPIQDFNMSYSQQFNSFGGDFWLPVDVRIEGLVEVGVVGLRFPPIGFKQVARLNDYEVNIPLPDSLYKDYNQFTVDSTTINSGDSLFVREVDVIPLDTQEKTAYQSLDSTATLEKAFKPKGFFTRFIDWEDEDNSSSSSDGSVSTNTNGESSVSVSSGKSQPSLFNRLTQNLSLMGRYNRVDNIYGGLVHTKGYLNNRLQSKLFGGYSMGYEEYSYGAQISWWPLKNTRRFAIYTGYKAETDTRYDSEMFSKSLTSFPVLFGYDDYFDYFRNKSFYTGMSYRMRSSSGTLFLKYKFEEHTPIFYSNSYDILGSNLHQRPNSYVNEGNLGALELQFSKGNNKKAFGAVGADDVLINIEQSASFLGSDWDYTRFKIDVYRSIETFYRRRFFPNKLEVRLNAGTYLGDLPIQKNGVLDVAQGVFTPFGAFKTKRFIPYEGGSYTALNVEHNFKSVPLEMLGWRNATKTGLSIITFGGIGRTWVTNEQIEEFNTRYGYSPTITQNWHIEAGLSLSNIFNLIRADLAYRIDEPGIYVGISIARFF